MKPQVHEYVVALHVRITLVSNSSIFKVFTMATSNRHWIKFFHTGFQVDKFEWTTCANSCFNTFVLMTGNRWLSSSGISPESFLLKLASLKVDIVVES